MSKYFIFLLFLFPVVLGAQRTLIADDAEIGDSLSLAGEWISMIRKDTNFWASTHGEVPSTRAILEWFGAQSAGIPGTGSANSLTYWDSDTTLNYTDITYSSTILDASALTGALRLPSGTDAQDPIWANGMLRYNTTTGGFQGYNGAERYLPWADADNWASGYIPFSNGNSLTTSNSLIYENNELRLGTADAGNYKFQNNNWESYFGYRVVVNGTINSNGMIDVYNSNASGTGIEAAGKLAGVTSRGEDNNLSFFAAASNNSTTIQPAIDISHKTAPWDGVGNTFVSPNAGRSIKWQYKQTVTNLSYKAAEIVPVLIENELNEPDIQLRFYQTIDGVSTLSFYLDSAGMHAPLYGSGNITGTPSTWAAWDANGKFIETTPADILSASGIEYGAVSSSTDGSGDVIVAHGLGGTPTSVNVTVTGTTPYIVTVHAVDGTNFTIRFYDTSGSVVTSTAITASWVAHL